MTEARLLREAHEQHIQWRSSSTADLESGGNHGMSAANAVTRVLTRRVGEVAIEYLKQL